MSSLPIIPSTTDVVSVQEFQSTKRSSTTPDEATVRTPGWQAAVLAVIAGYIDSYAFLNYRVYGSFMSRNTTLLQFALAALSRSRKHQSKARFADANGG
jgi:hypothetical protein